MSDFRNMFLFNETGKVLAPVAGQGVNDAIAASVVAKFQGYGFIPSNGLLEAIKASDVPTLKVWLEGIEDVFKAQVAGGVNTAPFYVNFPKQVMEASEGELFLNALMHYFGDMVGYRIVPEYEVEPRNERFFDFPAFKVVDAGSDSDVYAAFGTMLTGVAGWGDKQKEAFVALVNSDDYTFVDMIVDCEGFASRENRAYAASELFRMKGNLHKAAYGRVLLDMDTATDALRLAVAFSGYSAALLPSNEERIVFKSMPGVLRRDILQIIDGDTSALMNMSNRVSLFKTLGEKIHPGQYASRFPNAHSAFKSIRNGKTVARLSVFEKAYARGDVTEAVSALKFFPGDYVRRVYSLLAICSTSEDFTLVVDTLKDVASKVPTRMLWQVRSFFTYMISQNDGTKETFVRATLPKVAKFYVREGAFVDNEIAKKVEDVLISAIREQYSSEETKVGSGLFYVDESLKNVRVPNSLRDSTDSGMIIGRGSRLKMPEFITGEDVSTVRLFMHWSDLESKGWDGRVDLDLSALAYADDLTSKGEVWYGHLRDGWAVHSGDITSAPEGAAEYIDVDVNKALKAGVRYVVLNVISYTGQSLCDVPEAYAGAMVLSADAQAGEVFDMRNVINKFRLSTNSRSTSTLVFDLKTLEVITADMSLNRVINAGNNVKTLANDNSKALAGLLAYTGASIYDVVTEKVKAQGGSLVDKNDADFVVEYASTGLTIPMGEIISEWI